MTLLIPRLGILDIAPYVGGESSIPASIASSSWHRTRALWAEPERRSKRFTTARVASTVTPMAAARRSVARWATP